MKKLLLISAIFIASNGLNAQALLSDNFNSLTLGNVGTDITGATTGQGGFYTDATGGANTNFQIVNEGGVYGNVVQLTGSATATGTRYLFRDGLPTAWTARTAGNNVMEVEYEFYTGAATTSKNTMRVVIYSADFTKVLGGITMALDTKVVSGLAYYNNAGTLNNFLFNLSATPVTLAASTWVKVGFSFNLTSGEVKWKGPGFDSSIMGAGATVDPAEIDYIMTAGTANTVAGIGKFDNLVSRATSVSALLGNESFVSSNKFSTYPNPVNDILSISNSENINIKSISITDLNGRVVKNNNYYNVSNIEMNVSDLSSGMYIMNINSDQGTATKKIVKE
jgi:hypothetical protein